MICKIVYLYDAYWSSYFSRTNWQNIIIPWYEKNQFFYETILLILKCTHTRRFEDHLRHRGTFSISWIYWKRDSSVDLSFVLIISVMLIRHLRTHFNLINTFLETLRISVIIWLIARRVMLLLIFDLMIIWNQWWFFYAEFDRKR